MDEIDVDTDMEWDAHLKQQRLRSIKRLIEKKSIGLLTAAMLIGVSEDALEIILAGDLSNVSREKLGNGADNLEAYPKAFVTETQKVINIMFSCLSALHGRQDWFGEVNREQLMDWASDQLRGCGFPLYPVGSSWGSLVGEVISVTDMPSRGLSSIVRHYSKAIQNGRTLHDVHRHMRSEVDELEEAINGHEDDDGIVGESIDIIACALDAIFMAEPDITDEEIDAVMLRKCAKWKRYYSDSVEKKLDA